MRHSAKQKPALAPTPFLWAALAAGWMGVVCAGEQILRIDFGPAGSPSRPGYRAVAPTGGFDQDKGLGWLRSKGVRGHAYEPERVVDRRGFFGFREAPRFFVDDVTRDFITGRAPAVLAVAPGFKPVWMGVVAGFVGRVDAPLTPPIFDVRLAVDGKDVDAFTIPQPGMIECREYDIAGGPLTQITFASPHMAWVANAVILASAEGKAAAQAEFAALRQSIEFLPPDQAPNWRLARTGAAPAVRDTGGRGLRVVGRPWLDDFRKLPSLPGRPAKIRCFATPGEIEPFAFSVVATRKVTGIRFRAYTPKSPDGGQIPADRIHIYRLLARPAKVDEDWRAGRGRYELRPDRIAPAGRMDLAKGQVAHFYATVAVPADATPGHYLGQVLVAPADAPPQRLPLEVNVLPFTLPDSPGLWVGVEYDPPSTWALAYAGSPYEAEMTERLREREAAELRDMRGHGVNSFAASVAIDLKDKAPSVDEKRLQRIFAVFTKAKCRPPLVLELDTAPLLSRFGVTLYAPDLRPPDPPRAFYKQLASAVRRIDALADAAGAAPVTYVPYDYRGDLTHRAFVWRLAEALQPVVGDRLMMRCDEQLVPHIDLFVPTRCYSLLDPLRPPFDEARLAVELSRSNRRLWLATDATAWGLGAQPLRARWEAGFFARKHNALGVLLGQYQGFEGNPSNPFDSLSRGQGFTRPTANGPAPTLAWEGVREAVDDLRYVRALEVLSDAARKHERSSVAGKAYQARRDLDSMLKSAPPWAADSALLRRVVPHMRWRTAWWMTQLAGAVAGRYPRPKPSNAAAMKITCTPRIGAASKPRPPRKTVHGAWVDRPPVIDGKLDDACWKQATRVADFVDAEFGTRPAAATEMLLCGDGQNLYVAFVCRIAPGRRECRFKPSPVEAPIWFDPSVFIIIDPGNTHRVCYQIGVNRAGAVVDGQAAPLPNIDWRSGAVAKVTRTESQWIAELAIPRASKSGQMANDFWGFNAARRIVGPTRRWAVWSAGGREPWNPESLGRLVFEKPECYISDVRMRQPRVGNNRYLVEMTNPTHKAVKGRLTALMKHQNGRTDRTDFRVELAAGKATRYICQQPVSRPGKASLALALYDEAGRAPTSTALRTGFDVAPPLALRLAPDCGIVGEPVAGTMRLRIAPGDAQWAKVQFSIRRRGRRPVHSEEFVPAALEQDPLLYSLRFPTSPLRPGIYVFEAKLKVKGKTAGSDSFTFCLIDDF